MADDSLGFTDLDLDGSLDEIWEQLFVNIDLSDTATGPPYPPATVVVNGQNVLINDHGGTLFDVLREYAPHWCQVASEAYMAMYSWHGTTDARPLLQALALTLIHQAIDSFGAMDNTWGVECVLIPIGDHWFTTSFRNPGFMDALKKTITSAQNVFYSRTMDVVRYLVLPSPQHPGMIPSERLVTPQQIDYVNSLVVWNSRTGHNFWHDFRPNEIGVMMLWWFDRHSLKYLIETIHFTVGSPGYLYVQELYANLETGGEEWGPLTAATFHSTTWILATVHVYLWADVLRNQRFSTERFTANRRDAILEKQVKISILLKQILRKRVPGLTTEQSESAYAALHRFMHTNHNLPFLI